MQLAEQLRRVVKLAAEDLERGEFSGVAGEPG
jgi:hypothetical protein